MDAYVKSLQTWLMNTSVSYAMNNYHYAWRTSESIHFIGLSLLIGTVGLFDLRMMGLLRRVPLPALHRFIPFGILGYCMNVMTGLTFLAGAPDQYIYNPAFQMKMLFMGTAGLNVAVFYLTMYRRVAAAGPETEAPLPARIAGTISLLLDRCNLLWPIPDLLPPTRLALVPVVLNRGYRPEGAVHVRQRTFAIRIISPQDAFYAGYPALSLETQPFRRCLPHDHRLVPSAWQ